MARRANVIGREIANSDLCIGMTTKTITLNYWDGQYSTDGAPVSAEFATVRDRDIQHYGDGKYILGGKYLLEPATVYSNPGSVGWLELNDPTTIIDTSPWVITTSGRMFIPRDLY